MVMLAVGWKAGDRRVRAECRVSLRCVSTEPAVAHFDVVEGLPTNVRGTVVGSDLFVGKVQDVVPADLRLCFRIRVCPHAISGQNWECQMGPASRLDQQLDCIAGFSFSLLGRRLRRRE